MPEWLVERGIGESRAALVDDGEILESRIQLEGVIPAGSIIHARLKGTNRNAIAVSEDGFEFLLPRGAPGVTQGAGLSIEITRETMPGSEPWKRPIARMTDKALRKAPPLAEQLGAHDIAFPAPLDRLAEAGWNDLIEQARTGIVAFAGGELRICPTPAMTLIDVDGYLAPDELVVAGAAEAVRAIRRLDIGGSIGIDLPTAGSKAARLRAAEAIDAMLPPPFERTAVNGFGFVQIIRPRQRASLVELAQDRAGFEARALLRRASVESPGSKRLVAHPAVIGVLEQQATWLAELSRQVGGSISLRGDPALPISAGYAENA